MLFAAGGSKLFRPHLVAFSASMASKAATFSSGRSLANSTCLLPQSFSHTSRTSEALSSPQLSRSWTRGVFPFAPALAFPRLASARRQFGAVIGRKSPQRLCIALRQALSTDSPHSQLYKFEGETPSCGGASLAQLAVRNKLSEHSG